VIEISSANEIWQKAVRSPIPWEPHLQVVEVQTGAEFLLGLARFLKTSATKTPHGATSNPTISACGSQATLFLANPANEPQLTGRLYPEARQQRRNEKKLTALPGHHGIYYLGEYETQPTGGRLRNPAMGTEAGDLLSHASNDRSFGPAQKKPKISPSGQRRGDLC